MSNYIRNLCKYNRFIKSINNFLQHSYFGHFTQHVYNYIYMYIYVNDRRSSPRIDDADRSFFPIFFNVS